MKSKIFTLSVVAIAGYALGCYLPVSTKTQSLEILNNNLLKKIEALPKTEKQLAISKLVVSLANAADLTFAGRTFYNDDSPTRKSVTVYPEPRPAAGVQSWVFLQHKHAPKQLSVIVTKVAQRENQGYGPTGQTEYLPYPAPGARTKGNTVSFGPLSTTERRAAERLYATNNDFSSYKKFNKATQAKLNRYNPFDLSYKDVARRIVHDYLGLKLNPNWMQTYEYNVRTLPNYNLSNLSAFVLTVIPKQFVTNAMVNAKFNYGAGFITDVRVVDLKDIRVNQDGRWFSEAGKVNFSQQEINHLKRALIVLHRQGYDIPKILLAAASSQVLTKSVNFVDEQQDHKLQEHIHN